MFGDVFSGLLLFMFALYLVFNNDNLQKSQLGSLAKIRYLILLMSLNSMFCGLMYNDFTSIPLKLFGDSCYHGSELAKDCIYPIGVDPQWYLAKNELTYVNSMKMKISVILGVA